MLLWLILYDIIQFFRVESVNFQSNFEHWFPFFSLLLNFQFKLKMNVIRGGIWRRMLTIKMRLREYKAVLSIFVRSYFVAFFV